MKIWVPVGAGTQCRPFRRPQLWSLCTDCLAKSRLSSSNHRSFSAAQQRYSVWNTAVAAVQNTISEVVPSQQANKAIDIDPLKLLGKELQSLSNEIRRLLGSGHPVLDTVAKYYTQSEGKHVRPLLVLLMSQATAKFPSRSKSDEHFRAPGDLDVPISSPHILDDTNPGHRRDSASYQSINISPSENEILPSQRRLAEITELIHTASLLHDDVIDHSMIRRSQPSANIVFGNKMAVLAGDFLLGRASVALARLRNPEVVELLATVIANLVEGEFMQLKNTTVDQVEPQWREENLSYYIQKTYLKSASLISKSCRAAAILGQVDPEVADAAYAYGRNLGLAFQLVDDMLDYSVSGSVLGKPAGADLELGLATAPLLFAWKDRPELGQLIGRKFAGPGDVQKVRQVMLLSFLFSLFCHAYYPCFFFYLANFDVE